MNEVSENINPLLQIDTKFRTYLSAYTRSYQNHMTEGTLDYAYESDNAVRQKLMGLGGSSKLFKTVNTLDIAGEAKHLFLKCDQVGPLKYPEIYDIVKKCSERLELVVPIVFIREDIDRVLIYSIASELIEPCIVMTKQLAQMCTEEELTLLIGCECGRIQNNHCQYNMAYTYLNANKDSYKPVSRNYGQPVSNQLYAALSQWVKVGSVTANRAGIICLDKPGRFLDIVCGLYNKEYVDFYGKKHTADYKMLTAASESVHNMQSRALTVDSKLSEDDRQLVAANEFLYCATLYGWRRDIDASEQHTEPVQTCDVRTSIIIGNGGQI